MADTGCFDRRLHWIVSECGDLPCAFGDVGKPAAAFILPEVQRADPDVVEHAGAELAVVARAVCEVWMQNFDSLSDG